MWTDINRYNKYEQTLTGIIKCLADINTYYKFWTDINRYNECEQTLTGYNKGEQTLTGILNVSRR